MTLARATLAAIVAVLLAAAVAHAATWGAKPDCGDPQLTCAELIDSQAAFGYYVGHDESQVAFYSKTPGSGNHMQYQLTLPREPSGAYSPSNSYSFELMQSFWFGLTLCDSQSYPEETQQCKPDSDSNIVDLTRDPNNVPGSAYYELTFIPPGWATGCDATRWCAAIQINSFSENPINGDALNGTCQSQVLGGLEYTNWAYLTSDGKPLGPPDPLHWDPATSGNPVNPDTFLMGQGDHITVTISDTPSGVEAILHDLTTKQTASMVASATNGFGQIQFAPHGSSCTEVPYDFHPEYSTSTPQTRNYWAAHSTNVTFTAELGHFDLCTQITSEGGTCNGLEGIPSDQEPADSDDSFCFDAAASPLYPVTGCAAGNDPGFDGPSYQPDWPDGSANHPTPVAFTSPLTGASYTTPYAQAGFESDLPTTESFIFSTNPYCDIPTGAGCVNPPTTDDGTPAAFEPYFSAASGSGGCQWELGNFPASATVKDFGQGAEFGALNPIEFYSPPFGPSHGRTSTGSTDFTNILPNNPC